MQKHRGQSLLEMLLAMAIFAVVIIGLLEGLNVVILGGYRIDVRATALNLARSQMEYVKQQDYIEYNDSGSPVLGAPYAKITTIPDGFSADDISINVSTLDPVYSWIELQEIKVRVDYGNNHVEFIGRKANPDILPDMQSLPFVQTEEVYVPYLSGNENKGEASRNGTCDSGRFLLFYGYPYTFNVTREGAIAVTWIIDEDNTYGGGNLIDLYLYKNADFPNGGGRQDGPFSAEYYDFKWDTTCAGISYTASNNVICNCQNGDNWDANGGDNVPGPGPNTALPRIVIQDESNCYNERADYCHDEEVPGWNPPWPNETPASPGWIAHDEVEWDPGVGNVLTTVITGNASVPAGWYTILFYNSNPVHGSGSSSDTTGNIFTVATEMATVSYYSEP